MVLRQNGKVKKVLKEQQQEVESLAATVAASDMSIQQLRDQLALSQSSLASTTRELDALRELFRSREAEEATARCGVQSKAEDDRQDKEAENDLLREQVATLKEANRIAYARIRRRKRWLPRTRITRGSWTSCGRSC
ncbi:unnamed protein product [Prorocentrum cordatum]|uniref:Cilia- and flagella-associated protein 157 n=1 Tax=Prorocentrum cordatum TaxID=2364126 RepID=A0ABN9SU43_9DINO|nr:unnamed protein product [Polarella glacialis]